MWPSWYLAHNTYLSGSLGSTVSPLRYDPVVTFDEEFDADADASAAPASRLAARLAAGAGAFLAGALLS